MLAVNRVEVPSTVSSALTLAAGLRSRFFPIA